MARMRADERRRQLLEVAAKMFAKRGYRGTTTAELARAAGISEPILYRHFNNKLDMFVTLIDEVGEEVVSRWRRALANAESPQDQLSVLLAGNPATHKQGRGIYRVIFQAMIEQSSDRKIRAAIKQHFSSLHEFLATELRRLQSEGAVRNDEPAETLAWTFISTGIGYGMISSLGLPQPTPGSGKADVQRLLEEIVSSVKWQI